MNQEGFSLVADLYQILSKYPAAVMKREAAREGLSKNLRDAIGCLLAESSGADSPVNEVALGKRVTLKDRYRKSSTGGPLDDDQLQSLLTDKRIFPNKGSLIVLAELLDVELDVKSQDSRARTARKLVKSVADDPALRRELVMAIREEAPSETEGWLSAITRDL